MSNPFKYGSIVEDGFFTDRTEDLALAMQIIESSNHLILISPRRYGKTSTKEGYKVEDPFFASWIFDKRENL